MRSIYKYVPDTHGDVMLSCTAKLLHCSVDPKTRQTTFWFEVPHSERTTLAIKRRFLVVATGRDQVPMDSDTARYEYITTIVEQTGFVWHVYEKVSIQ